MITIKDAAKSAATFINNLYENANDIALEEIEFNDFTHEWNITLSFLIEEKNTNINANLANILIPYKRKFKMLVVDSNTGEVKKMKIWKAETA